jgi:RNA polymerase sigma factor (sigma-70 family)
LSDQLAERERRDRFEAIYEENYHRILGYARRRTNPDEAADVVADTFLVTWRRLENVPDGRAGLMWLYAAARRSVANHERARRRRERLSHQARTEIGPHVQEPPLEPTSENRAAAAWTRLRREDRELLALVAWEGLDASEIAHVYACSPNAARVRMHRARRRFARELARGGVSTKRNSRAELSKTSRSRVGALIETEDHL